MRLRPALVFRSRWARAWLGVWAALAAGQAFAAKPKGEADTPTYAKDVAAVLQRHCQKCHSRGQSGPFSLETYEQARKRASDIAEVAEARVMPPWKPTPGVGPKLLHDRSMGAREIALLRAWAEAGAPRGGEPRSVATPGHKDGWSLGEPDLVLEAAEEFKIPASGPDIYRCFVIPTDLPRDAYLSAVEYRPSNARVVHHMMAFVDANGYGRECDAAEPGPGYTSYSGPGFDVEGDLGGWTPGNDPVHLPDGVGRSLPRRSDLILQVHYHPTGKAEVDRPKVALYFAKDPVKQTLHWANASNYDFRLAPGNAKAEVKAIWFVPVAVDALAVTPHMHQLGRDFRMTVTFPDGRTRDLIHISDWDPAWQNTYHFEKPVHLPKGSTVKVVARYDNSAHSRNPHTPPKLVKWGHDATDEMCVGYIGVVKSGQDLTRPGEKDDLFDTLTRQTQKNMVRDVLAKRRR